MDEYQPGLQVLKLPNSAQLEGSLEGSLEGMPDSAQYVQQIQQFRRPALVRPAPLARQPRPVPLGPIQREGHPDAPLTYLAAWREPSARPRLYAASMIMFMYFYLTVVTVVVLFTATVQRLEWYVLLSQILATVPAVKVSYRHLVLSARRIPAVTTPLLLWLSTLLLAVGSVWTGVLIYTGASEGFTLAVLLQWFVSTTMFLAALLGHFLGRR